MNKNKHLPPDYLVIGHVTRDIREDGVALGGTAAYAAVCAQALGRKPAILTAGVKDQLIHGITSIPLEWKRAEKTTTFENIETPMGRKQILHSIAEKILTNDVPEKWKTTKIVHLGPVADEIDPDVADLFPNSFMGITPQGWMRRRDYANIVHYKPWENAERLLNRADAVVISIEDVQGDEKTILTFAGQTKILAVTEGINGARIYWNRDVRHFSAPKFDVVDPTGAGDIFAAVFFDNLEKILDPWESGRRAVQIASHSITREGLVGVPNEHEIRSFQIEVIEGK